jgi:putative ABC transport system permease protein
MKPIEARDQVKLGLRRCGQLALSGIAYRLLRSGITTGILALAVAFLVYVLVYGVLAERTQRAAWDALEPRRAAAEWLQHLTVPAEPATIRRDLAFPGRDLRGPRKYAGGLADSAESAAEARDEGSAAIAGFTRWAEALSPEASATLLGDQPPAAVLASLIADTDQRWAWRERARQLRLNDPPPGDAERWDRLAEVWPLYEAELRRLAERHAAALARLNPLDTAPLIERLAAAGPAASSDLWTRLRDSGFELTEDEWDALREFAADRRAIGAVAEALDRAAVRAQAVAAWGDADAAAVLPRLQEADAVEQLRGWADAAAADLDLPPTPAVTAAAQREVEANRRAGATADFEPLDRGTPFNLPGGTLWLVGLSLLVCAVGVTNALLMSVTERFNEIATMKCLGALDGSVMRVFVIEALLQGIAGGVLGVALGLTIAVLRGYAEFGGLFHAAWSGWPQVLTAAGLSLAIGVLLAAAAAVGPAWVASRLAPMEAMRVE